MSQIIATNYYDKRSNRHVFGSEQTLRNRKHENIKNKNC